MDTSSNVNASLRPERPCATLAASPQPEGRAPGPRLSPIDRSTGLLHWLARLVFRLRFGTVMMPLRVIFPRMPRYAFAHFALMAFYERGLSIPSTLRHLLSIRVSRRNQCSFCSDMHQAMFMLQRPPSALLAAAAHDQGGAALDQKTLAALAYADEVCESGDVGEATFERLRACFDERQLMEIVWVVAITTYLNRMARPLRMGSDGFCEIVRRQQTPPPPAGA